ncbi:hypothetical protein [Halostella litorea]|uniref:hypothetical protein n=1 Tax=Halostella litorea TaxID=2528831 RepID=UPI00192A30A8|nr:hypothetical protein [Halostella litorea]
MANDVRVRLAVLVGLAALAVGLAGVGTAVGVTDPIADADAGGEFVVADGSVTFAGNGENVTVVESTANVSEIRFEETDSGRFVVSTETDRPLTPAERDRAVEIARSNGTVRGKLAELDGYELAVEPVQRLEADQVSSYDVTLEADGNATAGETDVFVANATAEDRDGTVVVERDPSYAEDRAVVRVQQPDAAEGERLRYSVDVDLANDTVTDVTDWTAVGEESTVSFSGGNTTVDGSDRVRSTRDSAPVQ